MQFTVKTYNDESLLDFRDIAQIYESVGWQDENTFDIEKLRLSFKNISDVGLAISEGNECIGFSKAFSDKLYDTELTEVVVLRKYQGTGVGQALMDRIFRKFGHTNIYMIALKRSQGFFEKNGIIARPAHIIACSRAAREGELEGVH